MDRYSIALKKSTSIPELLKKVNAAKCPVCGDGVFIPKGFREMGSTLENPIVYCRDMGHWAGFLQDTKKVNETMQSTESY